MIELPVAQTLLDRGELDPAEPAIAALIEADPAQSAPWLLRARLLAARGQTLAAREACERAIRLWPDILPAYSLLCALAEPGAGAGETLALARRAVLAQHADDLPLVNRIAAALCAEGRFAEALPALRQTAPILGHQDSALWNYTTALAVTACYAELLASEPMLVAFSRDVAGPFSPFVHLVAAKLASRFDRAEMVGAIAARQRTGAWADAGTLAERLREAIAGRRPFSVLVLSEAHARLVTYARLENHLAFSRAEMSAVVNSVWVEAFGEPIEASGVVAAGALGRDLLAAIAEADVLALPHDAILAGAHEHFGYLAEMQRVALGRAGGTLCAGLSVLAELHEAMPFLRPLLAEQPFLGFVGSHPDLAERLARFCQIGAVASYRVPAALHRTDHDVALRGTGHYPALLEATLAALEVPQPGAIFLVAAGLLGPLYCGHIRRQGGIAIDIDSIIARWMPA